jgi:hypothetical protein
MEVVHAIEDPSAPRCAEVRDVSLGEEVHGVSVRVDCWCPSDARWG